MIKSIALLISSLFVYSITSAQSVAINTDGSVAHSSAMLDIKSTTRVLLAPRMTTVQRTGIAAPAAGLLVYDSDTNSYWYYNGSGWINLATTSSTGWLLTGNSGTNPSTHFIGTTDNQPLHFRLNNSWAGTWNHITNNWGIGSGSLQANTTGTQNVGFGHWALLSNTTGGSNTTIGNDALSRKTTGNSNTAIGNWALLLNTTGHRNVAIGDNALSRMTGNDDNVAVGYFSLLNNLQGQNTAVGSQALYANIQGFDNSAVGYRSLNQNTTGSYNTAVAIFSLQNNTTADPNTAVGAFALYSNTTGEHNTAVGGDALLMYTVGAGNTAVGNVSMNHNTDGSRNTAIGYNSLFNNTANDNNAFGYYALRNSTTEYGNCAFGNEASGLNTTGHDNCAFGYAALHDNSVGWANVAIGSAALNNNIGTGNIAIGYHAAQLISSGDDLTIIGNQADLSANNLFNATALGSFAIANGNNKVVIGKNVVGMVIGGYVTWSSFSDGRFKRDIHDDIPGLSFIARLRPVTYTVDLEKLDKHLTQSMPDSVAHRYFKTAAEYNSSEIKRQTGFIAQEVESAAKSYTMISTVSTSQRTPQITIVFPMLLL